MPFALSVAITSTKLFLSSVITCTAVLPSFNEYLLPSRSSSISSARWPRQKIGGGLRSCDRVLIFSFALDSGMLLLSSSSLVVSPSSSSSPLRGSYGLLILIPPVDLLPSSFGTFTWLEPAATLPRVLTGLRGGNPRGEIPRGRYSGCRRFLSMTLSLVLAMAVVLAMVCLPPFCTRPAEELRECFEAALELPRPRPDFGISGRQFRG
uniref:(northern house mosquito) hypothetical protein n=1 Tax=Culex pipiens TaxID=7175 RepID=A0A8D8NMR9_CULPI